MNSASNPIQGGVENHEGLLVEKSRMELQRVQQFIDILFQYIEVFPAEE